MISEKEYLEAKMVVQLYESQQLNNNRHIPEPPQPPPCRILKEGKEPTKPKNYDKYGE